MGDESCTSRNIQIRAENAVFRTTAARVEEEEAGAAALKDLLVPLQRRKASGCGTAAVFFHFKLWSI